MRNGAFTWSVWILAAGLVVFAWGLSARPMPASSVGSISFMIGRGDDVAILPAASSRWRAAKLNMGLFQGDQVRTKEESRLEVKLRTGSMLRIGERSVFQLQDTDAQGKNLGFLKRGSIWANIAKAFGFGASRGFRLRMPTAVCAVRGTIYRANVDSTTKVLVYDGSVDVGPSADLSQRLKLLQTPRSLQPVEVPGPTEIPPPYEVSLDTWVRIVQGFQVEIRDDGRYAKSQFDQQADAASDWVQWNKERDQLLPRHK